MRILIIGGVGGVIKNKRDLILQTPESFKNRFNIDVRIKNEVIKIDKENKEITIKKLETNEIYKEKYDKLVISTGAKPIFLQKMTNYESIIQNILEKIRNKYLQRVKCHV